MRKALLLLLLASAAPSFAATAQPSDAEERSERIRERAERAQAERAERAQRSERADREERAPREERAARREETQRGSFGIGDVVRGARDPAAVGDAPAWRRQERVGRADRGDAVGDWRARERGGVGAPLVQEGEGAVPQRMRDWRQRQLEQARDGRPADGRTAPVISRVPREGTQPPPPPQYARGTSSRHNWRGDWRGDRRYDWRSYRDRNRSRFRLGIYLDPFGWRYRPYSIGWRMWPGYYRSNYWLNDPWSYRLPYAPAGYRWIRYWDDAILVDTWSGEVVDVIRNFFW